MTFGFGRDFSPCCAAAEKQLGEFAEPLDLVIRIGLNRHSQQRRTGLRSLGLRPVVARAFGVDEAVDLSAHPLSSGLGAYARGLRHEIRIGAAAHAWPNPSHHRVRTDRVGELPLPKRSLPSSSHLCAEVGQRRWLRQRKHNVYELKRLDAG